MDLKGKVALVTGSSRGIGKSIILELAKRGCNVIINYIQNKELALNVKKEVNKYNVESLVIKADISNEEEVKDMVSQIMIEFGHIDILVNNASIALDNYLEDKSVEEFKKVIDVNLVGSFIVSKLVSEKMTEGTIINIASNNGIDQQTTYSIDYDASKAGIISLTHSFARSCPHLRVNAIAPGWINTEPVLSMNPDTINEEKNKIIMNRFGQPEEVAKLVCFLASDDASYINDSIIRIDGGIK